MRAARLAARLPTACRPPPPAAAALPAHTHPPPLLTPLLWQVALHWGYIPAIIAVGMLYTEPRPSWVQLLGPM